jgi:hypothetical protein
MAALKDESSMLGLMTGDENLPRKYVIMGTGNKRRIYQIRRIPGLFRKVIRLTTEMPFELVLLLDLYEGNIF